MIIFPAIDLYQGMAVRLYKGDYANMTVFSHNPEEIALDFKAKGAEFIHIVDLEGARDASTPNLEAVLKIKNTSGLKCEIGGGIRSMEIMDRYLSAGIDRVILGTAAVSDPGLVREAVAAFGEKVAIGIDIKDGAVAIKGWTEKSGLGAFEFTEKMVDIGVRTIICTDISRDGAMVGTNRELYRELSERFNVQITASGGVSTMEDVRALAGMGLYGAIIGKAYYTGAIDLTEAIREGRNDN